MEHKIRIIIGLALIIYGFIACNPWFFLGVIPLAVGITKFCPLCYFTGKCKIKED